MSASYRFRIAAILGNILEHYDSALFALLAPFIAPLFFDNSDPVKSLILTYAILPLGRLVRPFGSLFFGWIGDRWGRKEALSISLFGMAIVTVSIGCLPTVEQIGPISPVFLAIGRMWQSLFAAGESSGGAIFVLEHTEQKKRSLISGFFESSTVLGILLASFLVMLMAHFNGVETYWRFLFWGGGITAFFALFLRLKGKEGTEFTPAVKAPLLPLLFEHRKVLFRLILASGFSYTTYSIAFTFMNGFIPMVTSYTAADFMKVNTALLILDMLLLPCFGYLSTRFGKEKVMRSAAFASLIGAIPLFFFLNGTTALFAPLFVVVLGVAFSASYSAWALEQVPVHRYTLISLGYTLGSQWIRAPASFLCLLLYQQTGWTFAPGLYLAVVAFGAIFALSPKRVAQPARCL